MTLDVLSNIFLEYDKYKRGEVCVTYKRGEVCVTFRLTKRMRFVQIKNITQEIHTILENHFPVVAHSRRVTADAPPARAVSARSTAASVTSKALETISLVARSANYAQLMRPTSLIS